MTIKPIAHISSFLWQELFPGQRAPARFSYTHTCPSLNLRHPSACLKICCSGCCVVSAVRFWQNLYTVPFYCSSESCSRDPGTPPLRRLPIRGPAGLLSLPHLFLAIHKIWQGDKKHRWKTSRRTVVVCVYKRFFCVATLCDSVFWLNIFTRQRQCAENEILCCAPIHRTSAVMAHAILETFAARVEDSGAGCWACVCKLRCIPVFWNPDRLTHIGGRPSFRGRPHACPPVPLFSVLRNECKYVVYMFGFGLFVWCKYVVLYFVAVVKVVKK